MIVYVLRGLPASGKSTRAAELSAETGAEIVNRDNLRMALHGVWWSGDQEKENEVTYWEKSMVVDNLKNGRSVIIDATNLRPESLRNWRYLAEPYHAEVRVIDLDTDVDTCIARDVAREARGERSVGEEVIRRMAQQR